MRTWCSPRVFGHAHGLRNDFRCAKVFAQAGFKPRYVLVQPGQLLTLERIAHGEGCTLLSASQAQTSVKGLVRRNLKEGDALGIRIAAVWHRGIEDRARDKLGRQFAAVARSVLNARATARR